MSRCKWKWKMPLNFNVSSNLLIFIVIVGQCLLYLALALDAMHATPVSQFHAVMAERAVFAPMLFCNA